MHNNLWLGPLLATLALAAGVWLFYWYAGRKKPGQEPTTAQKVMCASGAFKKGY